MSPAERYKISGGNPTISGGLTQAQNKYGERFVNFFLKIVSAKRKDLMDIYRDFVKKNPEATFFDCIEDAVLTNAFDNANFPETCQLDTGTRRKKTQEVYEAAFPGRKRPIEINDRLQIFFGEGRPYDCMREAICRHCTITNCEHWLAPTND